MNQNVVPFRTRRRGCLFSPEVMAEIMVGANAPLHPKLAKAPLAKAPRTRDTCGALRGVRDVALISIMFACGLRVGEAAALHVSDFRPQPNGTALLRICKSNGDQPGKSAILLVPTGPATMVQRWLEMADATEGALFAALQTADYDSPPLITTRNMELELPGTPTRRVLMLRPSWGPRSVTSTWQSSLAMRTSMKLWGIPTRKRVGLGTPTIPPTVDNQNRRRLVG